MYKNKDFVTYNPGKNYSLLNKYMLMWDAKSSFPIYWICKGMKRERETYEQTQGNILLMYGLKTWLYWQF